MATYCSVLFYLFIPELYSPIPVRTIPYFIGAIVLTTFLVPFISIVFLKLSRRITSLEVTNREERIFPFLSIFLFYAITTYMFHAQLHVPNVFVSIMVIITSLILIVTIISFRFKISVHSTAAWGVAGIFSAINMTTSQAGNLLWVLAVILFIAGITTSSRLYLGRHTPTESWFGIILGFVFCFLGYYWFI